MTSQVTIFGTSFDLSTFTGTANGVGSYAVTEVSGGGKETVTVSSTTTVHKEFHIRLSSGMEKPVHLTNELFSVQNGNVVSAVVAVRSGQNSGHYVALRNHTTGQIVNVTDGLKGATTKGKIISPLALPAALLGLIPTVIAWANGYYMAALIFVALVASCARYAWMWYRDRKALGQAAVNVIEKVTSVAAGTAAAA